MPRTVDDIEAQDNLVARRARIFPDATVVDRRQAPSHGYRAVHIIVRSRARLIEVQIRTLLQHRWAELSEKLSDEFDPAIKYGGGHETTRELLVNISHGIMRSEAADSALTQVLSGTEGEAASFDLLRQMKSDLRDAQREFATLLSETIATVRRSREG